jgi:hypothetical protein
VKQKPELTEIEKQAEDIAREMVSKSWNEEVALIAEMLRELEEMKYRVTVLRDIAGENILLWRKAEAELEAARKVVDAAVDWADAQRACGAGAGGSSEYKRAREQLLYAIVREYPQRCEPLLSAKQAVIKAALEKVGEMEAEADANV